MKVDSQEIPNNRVFKPFQIILTIESSEEAAKLYGVFNSSPIVDSLSWDDESEAVRDAIESHYDGVYPDEKKWRIAAQEACKNY